MKKQGEQIFAEIDQHLATFTELYKSYRENKGEISILDIDSMKQVLRNLYLEVNDLSKTKENSVGEPIVDQKSQETISKPVFHSESKIKSTSAEEQHSPVITNYPEANTSIPSDNSILFAELLIETETTTTHSDTSVQNAIPVNQNKAVVEKDPAINVETVKEPKTSEIRTTEVQQKQERKISISPVTLFDEPVSSVKDKFKESESVYKQISKSHKDDSLVGHLQKKPVTDLRKSIGINERFAFINELFQGNQQFFSESIDKINSCASYPEADKMCNEIGKKMEWNTDSKIVEELNELIKRRFSA